MPELRNSKLDTRNTLLDVAEELFAEHGYDGVSVRDITDRAKARLASINYHFGSKKSLYNEIILRRAHVLSAERLELLNKMDFEQLEAKEGLYQWTRAFVQPLLKRSTEGDPGWKNYCRLIAQVAALRSSFPDAVMGEFDPTALQFIKALKQILPKLNNRKAHYAFQFMLGTTLYIFTENQRLDGMSDGKYSSADLKKIYPQMVNYIAGGLLNLLEQDSNPPTSRAITSSH